MKKVIIIGSLLTMMFGGLTINAQAQTQKTVEEDYCAEFIFTEDAARGKGVGESIDRQIARTEAKSEALGELAGKIETTVKMYAQRFKASMKAKDNDGLDVEVVAGVNANITEQIVNQKISYKTVCEKMVSSYSNKNVKVYECHMAVEIKKDDVEKIVYDSMKKNGLLQTGLAYQQFKEQYDQVMKQMAENEAVDNQ